MSIGLVLTKRELSFFQILPSLNMIVFPNILVNVSTLFQILCTMAIRVVEFPNGGYKIRFLPKNQHTQRKLLNFENCISGGPRSFQKSEF